jgi:hypothetical protein
MVQDLGKPARADHLGLLRNHCALEGETLLVVVYQSPDNDTQLIARWKDVWSRSIGNMAPHSLDIHAPCTENGSPMTSKEMLLPDEAC